MHVLYLLFPNTIIDYYDISYRYCSWLKLLGWVRRIQHL